MIWLNILQIEAPHAADDVFVDIDAKDTRDLLCDARTANTGIAALELDNRVDEFLRWPFWARAPMTTRRQKPPIFAFREPLVESQQGSGLQDNRELSRAWQWWLAGGRGEYEQVNHRHGR